MENSVYRVTSPSLHINENGPSLMLIGYKEEDAVVISSLFEKIYDTSITIFHLDSPLSNDNIAWARSVSTMSEFIIINPNTCSPAEVYMAVTAMAATPHSLFWVVPDGTPSHLFTMINSFVTEQHLHLTFDELAMVLNVPTIETES